MPPDGSALRSLVHSTRLRVDPPVRRRFALDRMIQFMGLPRLSVVYGQRCRAHHLNMHDWPLEYMYPTWGVSLRALHLERCCINHIAMSNLLCRTPGLKTLTYSHSVHVGSTISQWDICGFINEVNRRVGTHLEEFSVSADALQGHISPGSASAHGFKCLKKLEFPLDVVMCNIKARDASRQSVKPADNCIATSQAEDKLEISETCLKDLIPPSLRQLSLLSYGINGHQDALKVMFRIVGAL